MNIEIYKKHLVGKQVAFTTSDLTIYRGEISDVIEEAKFHGGSLMLVVTNANFVHVRVFHFVDGIMHCFKPSNSTDTSEPMCGEPIIDGAILFHDLMRRVILPEEMEASRPPSIKRLIHETGTFTGCKKLMDRFINEGLIRKEGNVLHVDFSISDQSGCICGFATRVEQIESVTKDLKKVFEVDEVVYHAPASGAGNLGSGNCVVIEVEPGQTGENSCLPGAYKVDPKCGTYPVIKGLGMRWELLAKKSDSGTSTR